MDKKNAAIEALILFRHLFCVDEEKTDAEGELCFRCSDCPMEDEDGKCAAKILAREHGTEEQRRRMLDVLDVGW